MKVKAESDDTVKLLVDVAEHTLHLLRLANHSAAEGRVKEADFLREVARVLLKAGAQVSEHEVRRYD